MKLVIGDRNYSSWSLRPWLAMKLMAMTFVRTSELIGAKWTEFDMEAARWNIPAVRMKMRDPHIVPLASQTIEVLEQSRCWKCCAC